MSILKRIYSKSPKNVRKLLFQSNKLLSTKYTDDSVTFEEDVDGKTLYRSNDEAGLIEIREKKKEATIGTKFTKKLFKGRKYHYLTIKDNFKFFIDSDDPHLSISQELLDAAILRSKAKNPDDKNGDDKKTEKPQTAIKPTAAEAKPPTTDKPAVAANQSAKPPDKSQKDTPTSTPPSSQAAATKTTADKPAAALDKSDKPADKPPASPPPSSQAPPPKDKTLELTIQKLKKASKLPVYPEPIGSPCPPPARMRLKRQEPGEVILHFIPREWFTAFFPKTGVTGFGTFLVTTGTFLTSKEYYVLEHNFYGGLSVIVMTWAVVRYVGPSLAQYLDQEIKEYEDYWNAYKAKSVKELNDSVDEELYRQFQAEGNLLLVDAKRENVALQLENEFRKRQMKVYNAVVYKLDYQVERGNIIKKIHQKNLVDYVIREVYKALTPELEAQLINASIDNLVTEMSRVNWEKRRKEVKCQRMEDESD